MKFKGRRQSSNINDARGSGGGFPGGGFPGGGKGGLGLGGLILVLLIAFMGGDVSSILGDQGAAPPPGVEQTSNPSIQQEKDDLYEFTSVVLADTEDVWSKIFADHGRTYNPPQTQVYSGSIRSGCGFASAQVGPFYCPADQTIYLDLSFYKDLHQKFGAGGDFAFAYVIAHEVGHHVQRELGVLGQVQKVQQQMSKDRANQWNVALELQADYLAGVVARFQDEAGYLEEGDIQEAIRATEAVGDDTIQKRAQGYVVPDSFTHGSADQRHQWYLKGYKSGSLRDWDTYTSLGLQ